MMIPVCWEPQFRLTPKTNLEVHRRCQCNGFQSHRGLLGFRGSCGVAGYLYYDALRPMSRVYVELLVVVPSHEEVGTGLHR